MHFARRLLELYLTEHKDFVIMGKENLGMLLVCINLNSWHVFLQKDIVLFGNPIIPVNVVRNLGVILDENMTMSEHIARVCRNCYYQLRQK